MRLPLHNCLFVCAVCVNQVRQHGSPAEPRVAAAECVGGAVPGVVAVHHLPLRWVRAFSGFGIGLRLLEDVSVPRDSLLPSLNLKCHVSRVSNQVSAPAGDGVAAVVHPWLLPGCAGVPHLLLVCAVHHEAAGGCQLQTLRVTDCPSCSLVVSLRARLVCLRWWSRNCTDHGQCGDGPVDPGQRAGPGSGGGVLRLLRRKLLLRPCSSSLCCKQFCLGSFRRNWACVRGLFSRLVSAPSGSL